MEIGPRAKASLSQLSRVWKQGQHVLITGSTGSGKTRLAREVDDIRLRRGGNVVVFLCKTQPDPTIEQDYKGFTRWTTWHKRPSVKENRILFWPKVEGKSFDEAIVIMRREFKHAFAEISKTGRWTVHIDEGLFVTSPHFLGLSNEVGLMYQFLRSAKGTMIALAQRPAHLPLTIYSNISHAFIGRASEAADIKRLADMGGRTSSRTLQRMISENGAHDFLWIPIGTNADPVRINLAE